MPRCRIIKFQPNFAVLCAQNFGVDSIGNRHSRINRCIYSIQLSVRCVLMHSLSRSLVPFIDISISRSFVRFFSKLNVHPEVAHIFPELLIFLWFDDAPKHIHRFKKFDFIGPHNSFTQILYRKRPENHFFFCRKKMYVVLYIADTVWHPTYVAGVSWFFFLFRLLVPSFSFHYIFRL